MIKLQVDPYNTYMMNPVDEMRVRSNDARINGCLTWRKCNNLQISMKDGVGDRDGCLQTIISWRCSGKLICILARSE